jgi:hypothetical protein
MKAVEPRSEIYLMALQSLSKSEREAVISRLLEDAELREDILDLITIHQRQGEPSRPFREYLAETRK